MDKNLNKSWENNFKEFLDTPNFEPPTQISERTKTPILKDLNPQSLRVFIKLLVISFIGGIFSLTICPQFGYGKNLFLMNFIMKFGVHFCSLACGAIFLGVGMFLAALLLKPEEMRVIKKTQTLQLFFVSSLLLTTLIGLGKPIILSLAILWLVGAITASFLVFEVLFHFKLNLLKLKSV